MRNSLGQITKGHVHPEKTKQKMRGPKLKYWKKQKENPRCRSCGNKLTNKNWLPSDKKSRHYRCVFCERKRAKLRTQKLRDYRRKYIVRSTDNKYLKGKKRPWTSTCEMCEKQPKLLGYHHWDDEDISKGVWVCPPCHVKIEAIDNPELVKKWRDLKARINKEIKEAMISA